ncbi:MAG TPA: glycosyltransferase, partial [Sporichthya sp.]|nr:glycosyltransferase [Sporichthya sp.]
MTVGGEAAALAAGFARTLCDYGWDAFLVPREGWASLGQDLDVIVACSPRFVPSAAPGKPVLLGWAAQPGEFAGRTDLAAYDAMLAPSALAAERLAGSFDGPITLLPPAVDAPLFRHGDAVVARQGTPLVDVAAPLERALAKYRGAVAVVCESSLDHRSHGVPPLTLLHAVAAGALPVGTSRLGLMELGLGEVDVATDAEGIAAATEAAVRHPDVAAVQAQRLRNVLMDRHTWPHRLAAFEAAIERAKEAHQQSRTVVGYFPDYADNPYQRMLYAATVAAGVRLVPLPDPINA